MMKYRLFMLVVVIFIVKKVLGDDLHDDSVGMATSSNVNIGGLLLLKLGLSGRNVNVRPKAKHSLPNVAKERAFSAYWNLPTYQCLTEFGIDLRLDSFDITANAAGNVTGEAIVLFSQLLFGLYPHFDKVTNQPINGGLPQLGNLTLHLEKSAQDVVKSIPNATFSGLAVIDWELWQPQWEMTSKIYVQKSLELVRRRHPDWDADLLELVAKVEYEGSARSFMESTLSLIQEMRPNAQLGFYHFPKCLNSGTESSDCDSKAVLLNDKITWLFSKSTAIYPSIYLHGYTHDFRGYVKSNVEETMRVRKMSDVPHVPVFAYTRFNYSHSGLFFSKEDLNNTILQSAELGANGVVFWGDHNDTHSIQACMQLQRYLNVFLGPFVKEVIATASTCSEKVCSGHGRCVGDISRCSESRGTKDSKQTTECTCSCYEGWKGETCDIQGPGKARFHRYQPSSLE